MIRLRSPLESSIWLTLVGAVAGNLWLATHLFETREGTDPQARTIEHSAETRSSGVEAGISRQPSAIGDLNIYKTTLERPLFQPDRRPWKPEPMIVKAPPSAEPIAPPKPVELPTAVKLVGIHMSSQEKRALIQPNATASAQWIEIGGEMSGWVVQEITENGVILRNGSVSRELQLYVEK